MTVVVVGGGLGRQGGGRRCRPSMGDGDRMRRRPEALPRRGASRSRRRSGKTYVVAVVTLSGCVRASVAVTHVLPASESDDVTHVLVRAHHGGAADAALQTRATGAVASFW